VRICNKKNKLYFYFLLETASPHFFLQKLQGIQLFYRLFYRLFYNCFIIVLWGGHDMGLKPTIPRPDQMCRGAQDLPFSIKLPKTVNQKGKLNIPHTGQCGDYSFFPFKWSAFPLAFAICGSRHCHPTTRLSENLGFGNGGSGLEGKWLQLPGGGFAPLASKHASVEDCSLTWWAHALHPRRCEFRI